MNENINLCELLRGHERETFYCPIIGNVTLEEVLPEESYPIKTTNDGTLLAFTKEGLFINDSNGECLLFPSKDQRDWNKWAKEQTPKTWSELTSFDIIPDRIVSLLSYGLFNNPIEKSAIALLKICQLIEVGYGGNITNEEWDDDRIIKYTIKASCNNIVSRNTFKHKDVLAFHTKEQRDEFLSYPENVQLIKDFYMI